MIQIKHLQKSFGKIEVLTDVNLNIKCGEVISIIGPSGTGKSTFLRCLNLLEQPTGGSIIIDGEEVTGVTTMQMDEGIDTGDMLLKKEVAIDKKETGGSLFDKLALVGAKLCVKTMEAIENGTGNDFRF